MGRPRLFVGISAGNLDSMLNKLTAQKKVRNEDQYSPGGAIDRRPNRATIVYSNLCRQAFASEPRLPIVLGGMWPWIFFSRPVLRACQSGPRSV